MVLEDEVEPRSPVRLPNRGTEGTTRGDATSRTRLIHIGDEPAVLAVAEAGAGRLSLRVEADDDGAAQVAMQRLRFWTGVDDDLTPFLEGFADDALIGASVRASPQTRPYRRPTAFEMLVGAICEQLVDDERSQQIKRAVVRGFGRRAHGLVDGPSPQAIADLSPAQLQGCGLAANRASTLIRAAREVATGRVDLHDPARREQGWRRLRAMPGIGPWTVSLVALHGQGYFDAMPAGDFAFRRIVGLLLGRRELAQETEVTAFMAPYRPWRGVAAWHLLRMDARGEIP